MGWDAISSNSHGILKPVTGGCEFEQSLRLIGYKGPKKAEAVFLKLPAKRAGQDTLR